MPQLPIYLDYNATTPCDPRVADAMMPYFTEVFGNAASHHHPFGWQAEEAVDHAREQVAKLIGAEPGEIIFTSGATEADNLALKGVFEKYAVKGKHIITWNAEHKAVLDTCKHLEKAGAEITYLEVAKDGLPDLSKLETAIKPTTILIALMYANNEIGTINPIKQVSAISRKHGVIFFTDATQAVGKIPVDVNKDEIDLMAFSAHKMYGPKGVGALYIRRKNPRVNIPPQIDGGGHEKGIRSGTLNVPGIVGLGKAAGICRDGMLEESQRIKKLRDRLEDSFLQTGEAFVNGTRAQRLPHVSNMTFTNADGDALIRSIAKNIAVSSGAACTSATPEPSHVLKALGLDDDQAHGAIRFSLGRFTTDEEIDFVVKEVKDKLGELKNARSAIQNV
jgi:cysteine desulfurase